VYDIIMLSIHVHVMAVGGRTNVSQRLTRLS